MEADPFEVVVEALGLGGFDPSPTGPDSCESRCPGHDGSRRNLSLTRGDDGRALIFCHHEPPCSTEAIAEALGLTMRDLFPAGLRTNTNGHASPAQPRARKPPRVYATFDAAAEALERMIGRPASKRWAYRTADRKPVAAIFRFDLDGPEAKTFRPISKVDGGWAIKDPPGRWPLYRLPEIVDSPEVVVVEGEKCAGLAVEHGFAATTTAHGAKSANKTDLSPLKGKDIFVVPDHDEPGERYASSLCDLLDRLDPPPRIKIVRLPLAKEGDDVEQFFEQGGTAEQLRELIESAEWLAGDSKEDSAEVASAPSSALIVDDAGDDILNRPTEEEFDPHRLARLYRDRSASKDHPGIVYWRSDFHVWSGSSYRRVSEKEIRASLTAEIKREADRLSLITQQKPRKVTTGVVSNALQALTSYTLLSSAIEQPCWLCEDKSGLQPAHEILPAPNGLIHLPGLVENQPGAIQNPTPLFFAPWVLSYPFDPAAAEPAQWFKFLEEVWPGDPQSIETLQEWFGYLLTCDTSQQKILALIGASRSGKGTIARILADLIGLSNVARPSFSSLGSTFGLESLIGKPVAIIADARISGKTDQAPAIENLLRISGEDYPSIPRKHRGDWEGRLSTRFVLISNDLPKLADSSGALANRFCLLRFSQTFLGREDPKLTDKLRAELPGVLLWSVAGWDRLRRRGHFVQPKSSEEMIQQIRDLGSPHSVFVRERCRLGPAESCLISVLYDAWVVWCQDNGRTHYGAIQDFGKEIRSAFPELTESRSRLDNRSRRYQGITVKLRESW